MAEALYIHVPAEQKPSISYRVIECGDPGVQTTEERRHSRKWKGPERKRPSRLMGAGEEQALCGVNAGGLQWRPRGFSCLVSQKQFGRNFPY